MAASIIKSRIITLLRHHYDFINIRLRQSSLRSHHKKSSKFKLMYNSYTNFIICNHYYLKLFLDILQSNNNTTTARAELNSNFVKQLILKGHEVIENYENTQTEGEYLNMCNNIKTEIDSSKLIIKYIQRPSSTSTFLNQ